MASMKLLDETVQLLDQARSEGLSLRQIASEPEIPYEWLKKFAAGSIPDPSVNRIQALHGRLQSLDPRAAAT